MQNSIHSLSSDCLRGQHKKEINLSSIFKTSSFALSLFFATACHQAPDQGWSQGPAELPMATVHQDTVEIETAYSASIEGIANIEIRPQVSGYLRQIYVDEGAYVKAGQPLFKIEDHVYQEQIRNAQASLISAKANLATAKINLDRKKELVNSKIVTELQVQEAQAAYDAAQGAVAQAQSTIETAKINLGFSVIKAPVSGYVGRFNYRLGSLLAPSNAEAITVLSDIQQVYAYFSMSENDFVGFQERYAGETMEEKLKNAPELSLITSNGSKYELPGKIDAVEGQFNKTTGSITLRAKFNNPKMLLRSGNTGKVVLAQTYDNALLFPISSTMSIQDKVYAFCVDQNGKAEQRQLRIAGKAGLNFIVTDGIKAGDKYIVSGFDRLRTGDPVVEHQPQTQEVHDTKS